MMSPKQWGGLGVQDFFNGFNWSGKPPKLPPVTITVEKEGIEVKPLKTEDLLSLNLQTFLKQGNWSGLNLNRSLSVSSPSSPTQSISTPVLSLKSPVYDFFKGIPWKGNGLSPSAPSSTPKKKNSLAEAIPEPSEDWTITDLSDLL